MIYPWQKFQWQQWALALQAAALPHALCLVGEAGLGKLTFAEAMIRAVFCQRYDLTLKEAPKKTCVCHACQLLNDNIHPNIFRLQADNQVIKIDEVRKACDFIAQTAVHGFYRFVLIESANKMNQASANALLKTLEEPAAGGILILINDQEGRLPPTLISRCRRIVFSKPKFKDAYDWLVKTDLQQNKKIDLKLILNIANGSPIKALNLLTTEETANRQQLYEQLILLAQRKLNPVTAFSTIQKIEFIVLLNYLIVWIKDLMHLKLKTGEANIINQDFLVALQNINSRITLPSLMSIFNFALDIYFQIARGINLNKQLVIESLFFRFRECVLCN